ncbi:hypothetical protein HYALB_00007327 [Hymenoscyphus albidus]|uniref:PLD phosphodiesterase domain-containing protein n=1 Tax=Hymenoscyphus albidus TaxID=595503 RepID=A0A9N9LBH8_9HELO|nr:hypothetical protein HYALB_00007327 [Hymenoscyphus albidus]
MASPSHPVIKGWIEKMERESNTTKEITTYYTADINKLITTSEPQKFSVGTGAQILSNVLPKCVSANHELILVTCFWADSSSRKMVGTLLEKLSSKGLAQGQKIHFRLCFSSHSKMQKLFGTSSPDGQVYPPDMWMELGLPSPALLMGLDLIVKCIFVRPFSVVHPKFILVDRKLAFMPSCNVSWEDWFEGCIELRGEICKALFYFWVAFWSKNTDLPHLLQEDNEDQAANSKPADGEEVNNLIQHISVSQSAPITTILLPSPHHRNPNFRPFGKIPIVPHTPLNKFLIHIFETARQEIFIQTPNLTARAVIRALLSALIRGVNIRIQTSCKLMTQEQLVTAGTITEFEVWKLRRRHSKLRCVQQKKFTADPEIQEPKLGTLDIAYYRPKGKGGNEPVKAHMKLTIVDEGIVVLGSGNMDRASWYTSQELGAAFFSKDMAKSIRSCVEEGLEGRLKF